MYSSEFRVPDFTIKELLSMVCRDVQTFLFLMQKKKYCLIC